MKKLLFLFSLVFVVIATVLPTQTATASVVDQVAYVVPASSVDVQTAEITIPYDWLVVTSDIQLNEVNLKTVSTATVPIPIGIKQYSSEVINLKINKKGIGLNSDDIKHILKIPNLITLSTCKKGIGLITNYSYITTLPNLITLSICKKGIGLIK